MAVVLLAFAVLTPRAARAEWQGFKAAQGGLSNNLVSGIAEDASGRMWFATAAGASAFDGARWLVIRDSLPGAEVLSVLGDRAGNLWFGTANGLARLSGTRWSRFLGASDVQALVEDHRGDVWAGTDAGLARYQPATDTWTLFAPQAGGLVSTPAKDLLEDSRHRLWVGTPFGVSMLDSTRTQWTTFTADPNALGRDSVLCLAEDAAGRIWFGTDQGAWSFGADGWRHWTTADGLAGDIVLSMARDRAGRLWLGGLDGVAHGDGTTFRTDRLTSDGARIGPVNALRVDSAGNIWMGGLTYEFLGVTSQGVFRHDGVTWRNYYRPDPTNPALGCAAQPSPNIPTTYPLPGNCMTAGLQDHAGDLWFGTLPTGLARLARSGAWSTLRRAPGRPLPDSVSALAEDRQHRLWVASPGSGLASADSTRASWTLHSQASGLPSDVVNTLFVDATGDLWAGTAAGAARHLNGAWAVLPLEAGGAEVQRFAEDTGGRLWVQSFQGLYSVEPDRATVRRWTTADGLADDYPTALLAARDGTVWVGTTNGVSRLAAGQWSSWPNLWVNGVREAPDGSIWVAGMSEAARWDGSAWETFRVPQLPGTPVTDVHFEPNGAVWAATEQSGVGRYDGRSWKKLDSKGNGLTSDQVLGVVTDTQGRMWVLCQSGLAEHEPDLTAPQTVFVNTNEAVSPSRNVSLVFGAAYGELADLEYKSQWDGQPWSDWTADNTWYRQGVADGTHTFSVRARDWAGNADPTPATYTFEIDATPPAAELATPGTPLLVPGQGVVGLVRGTCALVGSTADPRFREAVVEARRVGAPTWTHTLSTSGSPVTADTLATWDTTGLADGDWEIRVAVGDTLGLTGIARVRVIVDNAAPFAHVTSPVRLVAGEGGDIWTTNAEAHLYFPPNAFDADPVVSVDSLAAGGAPDTLPGGVVRRGPAWDIGWVEGSLVKPGTLELRPSAPGGALAVWRRHGVGAWARLGGTPQPGGALALVLDAPGQYALFAEAAPPASSGTLSALTFTPRAFSPRGAFATPSVAIGFALGRPGTATLKLYNRAGRLVRVVTRGMAATAGENLVRWDGRDDDGALVEAGLYLVTVEALGETLTRPLAVLP